MAIGNAKITDPSGPVIYANDFDITDDFRDGFVDSLRVETPDRTHFAAEQRRAHGRQADDVRQRRLHRLRALQGASRKAAALAGEGDSASSPTTRKR